MQPGAVKRNKTACVHYVVPNQQTRHPRHVARNQQLNNNTTVVTPDFPHTPHRCVTGRRVTAVIAWGKRPVPFRTRKLRPTAPMVLHPGGCGRVGHRRTTIKRSRAPTSHGWGSPAFNPRLQHTQPAPNPDAPSAPVAQYVTLSQYPSPGTGRSLTTRRFPGHALSVPAARNGTLSLPHAGRAPQARKPPSSGPTG